MLLSQNEQFPPISTMNNFYFFIFTVIKMLDEFEDYGENQISAFEFQHFTNSQLLFGILFFLET